MYDESPQTRPPVYPLRPAPRPYYPPPPPVLERLRPSANWRFLDQLIIWVGIFGTLLLTFHSTRWLLRQVIGAESSRPDLAFSIEAFAYFMAYIWVFIITVGVALGLEKNWADMGFQWPRQPWLWAGLGLVIGWVFIPIRITMVLVLMLIFDPNGLTQEDSQAFGDELTGWLVVALLQSLAMVVVLAPLVEEFIFRGVLQPWLRRRFGVALSILGSGILFGLAHQELWLSLSNIVMGLVLASIYEYTGSLWVTIWIHFVNNATVIALVLVLTLLAALLGG